MDEYGHYRNCVIAAVQMRERQWCLQFFITMLQSSYSLQPHHPVFAAAIAHGTAFYSSSVRLKHLNGTGFCLYQHQLMGPRHDSTSHYSSWLEWMTNLAQKRVTMGSKRCSLKGPDASRVRCQPMASPWCPMQLQNLQPHVRCAHRAIHPCPHSAALPRQKVGWTQLCHPALSPSYLLLFPPLWCWSLTIFLNTEGFFSHALLHWDDVFPKGCLRCQGEG